MSEWKGLILAGGTGSRLHPLTFAVNKHLLAVYDKPMIYYPLSTLMLAGVQEFVVVSAPDTLPQLQQCLGNGKKWGLSIGYVAQTRPRGIADGLCVAREQLAGVNVAMILGDNIFYGTGLPQLLRQAIAENTGATIFGYPVTDPTEFGVVSLNKDGVPVGLEEKPADPKSNLAVPGLYMYDRQCFDIAAGLKPSSRGELEITDVNRAYLEKGQLTVRQIGRGVAWLDGGTQENLFEASQFVKVMEDRTGLKIACPEEIALRMGFLSQSEFSNLVPDNPANDYDRYLCDVLAWS